MTMTEADLDRMIAQAEYEYSLVIDSVAPEYRQRLEKIIELTDIVCLNHLAPLDARVRDLLPLASRVLLSERFAGSRIAWQASRLGGRHTLDAWDGEFPG